MFEGKNRKSEEARLYQIAEELLGNLGNTVTLQILSEERKGSITGELRDLLDEIGQKARDPEKVWFVLVAAAPKNIYASARKFFQIGDNDRAIVTSLNNIESGKSSLTIGQITEVKRPSNNHENLWGNAVRRNGM